VILSACGTPTPQELSKQQDAEVQISTGTSYVQTGYPGGEVQYETVFADGILYRRTDGWKLNGTSLDENSYTFLGYTVSEDILNFPDEQLEASRIPVGSAVYFKEGLCYVVYAEADAVGVFEPAPDHWIPGGGFLPEITVRTVFINGTLYTCGDPDRLSEPDAKWIAKSVLETKDEYELIGTTLAPERWKLPHEDFGATVFSPSSPIYSDGENLYCYDKFSSKLIRLTPAPADWIPGEYLES
ncbi:MAG: hypothetical protein IKZ19_01630, partial [Clostridia bacterium]|nr:hypothetical protein [Clostridia bacterium]